MKNIKIKENQIEKIIEICEKYAGEEINEDIFIDQISQICGETIENERIKLSGGKNLREKLILRMANKLFNEVIDYRYLNKKPYNYAIIQQYRIIIINWIIFAAVLALYVCTCFIYGNYKAEWIYILQISFFIMDVLLLIIQMKNALKYKELYYLNEDD